MGNALAANKTLASGNINAAFTSWGAPSVQGDWKIVQEGDKTYIELAENFKARKGPDVKIFLSPLPASDVTGKNAVEGSIFVNLIEDFKGGRRIELPADAELSQYQSLVFHCEAYSKLWGSAPL